MTLDPVLIDIGHGVATLTLADEDNRNALGPELVEGLANGLDAALVDPTVRAVVVTNSGRTFCAGANLKQASAGRKAGDSSAMTDLLARIMDAPKPVVGRIAGHVVGGGVGLAAALDIAIAADDVTFGFSEVRLGVAPAIISVVCLPKMRRADALETFLRGDRWPAARAAELGLIADAVPRERLDQAVEAVLADVRLGGPNGLAAAKELVNRVPGMARGEAFAYTAERSTELFNSTEAAEGMAAFLEKRRPSWAPELGS